jgi:hypothetical protein
MDRIASAQYAAAFGLGNFLVGHRGGSVLGGTRMSPVDDGDLDLAPTGPED